MCSEARIRGESPHRNQWATLTAAMLTAAVVSVDPVVNMIYLTHPIYPHTDENLIQHSDAFKSSGIFPQKVPLK